MAGTRWIRLDVDYFTNPKTMSAGKDGRLLHLASICWVGQHLTDGHIPGDVAPILCRLAGVSQRAIHQTVNAGLWLPTEADYYIHDYLEHNSSRGDVERERESWRLRQKRRRNPTNGQFQ